MDPSAFSDLTVLPDSEFSIQAQFDVAHEVWLALDSLASLAEKKAETSGAAIDKECASLARKRADEASEHFSKVGASYAVYYVGISSGTMR